MTTPEPQSKPRKSTAGRHRHGTRALAAAVAAVAGPALRKRGLAEAEVLTRWSDIVGRELARRCRPERLRSAGGKGSGGTLVIRAGAGWAIELQHLEPQIVERVNGFFGYRAVDQVRIVQGPVADARETRRDDRGAADRGAAERVSAALADIPPGPLKDALAALGVAVADRKPADAKRARQDNHS